MTAIWCDISGSGDRVEVIALPWRPYGRSLLDNLNSRLQRRLKRPRFDVLLQDELVHPSCFWLNQRLRPRIPTPSWPSCTTCAAGSTVPPGTTGCTVRWKNAIWPPWTVSSASAAPPEKDVEDLVGPGRPLVVATPGRDGLPGAITPEEIMARAAAPAL